MSPLTVRRYRAERLLRQEFEAMRVTVIASVRRRLRASGVTFDQGDLEACYAQAWQGLYTMVLDGEEIANPAGWLTLVTFRRAIDEQRARASGLRSDADSEHERGHALETRSAPTLEGGEGRDFATQLDDRMRLRQLFEGLRGHLSAREREAATLCYLQGLSRAEAAARMGISEARMRKLMEGQGRGGSGVAAKMGALVQTIGDGGWCDAQGSLMRGFAYGIHDPNGQRYQLALLHHDQCPACRAYVRSLRGLASVLPPVLVRWGVGVGAMAGSGAVAAGGTAGGSWLLAGGTLGGKLAAGCLLALSVGAGCLALSGIPDHSSAPGHRRHPARVARVAPVGYQLPAGVLGQEPSVGAGARAGASSTAALTPLSRVSREFGPEQALAAGSVRSVSGGGSGSAIARSASVGSVSSPGTAEPSAGAHGGRTAQPASAEASSKAAREFSPG